jgi:hypothetical protein
VARIPIIVGLLGLLGSAGPGRAAPPPVAHFAVSATIVARCTASTPSVVSATDRTAAGPVTVDCGGSTAMGSASTGSSGGPASVLTAPSRIHVDESDAILRVTVEF